MLHNDLRLSLAVSLSNYRLYVHFGKIFHSYIADSRQDIIAENGCHTASSVP